MCLFLAWNDGTLFSPEEHFPADRTADEVANMLGFSIQAAKGDPGSPFYSTSLHADNWGGQNKKKLIVWYQLRRTPIKTEDEIKVCFLAAGHTKNRCGGEFGFVERELKRRDFLKPEDMVETVRCSSVVNKVFLPAEVECARGNHFRDLLLHPQLVSGSQVPCDLLRQVCSDRYEVRPLLADE